MVAGSICGVVARIRVIIITIIRRRSSTSTITSIIVYVIRNIISIVQCGAPRAIAGTAAETATVGAQIQRGDIREQHRDAEQIHGR